MYTVYFKILSRKERKSLKPEKSSLSPKQAKRAKKKQKIYLDRTNKYSELFAFQAIYIFNSFEYPTKAKIPFFTISIYTERTIVWKIFPF